MGAPLVLLVLISILCPKLAFGLSCQEAFQGAAGKSLVAEKGQGGHGHLRELELKFLQDSVGSGRFVLVLESDLGWNASLRRIKILSSRKTAGGVVQFRIEEESYGQKIEREIGFPSLEVVGPDWNFSGAIRSFTKQEMELVSENLVSESGKEKLKQLFMAMREQKKVVLSGASGGEALSGEIEAIDADSLDVVLIRVTKVNGTNLSRTILLSDFRDVQLLGAQPIQRQKGIDISHLWKQKTIFLGPFERQRLDSMEYYADSDVRKKSWQLVEQAIESGRPVRWKEKSVLLVGRAVGATLDDSNMLIVELKSLDSEASIYRTLTALDGIEFWTSGASTRVSRDLFENENQIFYRVDPQAVYANGIEAQTVLREWKWAVENGADVQWYETSRSRVLDGRIERVYSEPSGEILVVVKTRNERVVKTLDGFLAVPAAIRQFKEAAGSEDLHLPPIYPTVVNATGNTAPFDSRVMIPRRVEVQLSMGGFGDHIQTLKKALESSAPVELQLKRYSRQTGSDLTPLKKKAYVRAIEENAVLFQFEGERQVRMVSHHSIGRVKLVN